MWLNGIWRFYDHHEVLQKHLWFLLVAQSRPVPSQLWFAANKPRKCSGCSAAKGGVSSRQSSHTLTSISALHACSPAQLIFKLLLKCTVWHLLCSPFKVYSSVMLCILTLLCNTLAQFFILKNWNSIYIKNQFSISLYPQSLTTTIPFSVSMNLTTLNTWNHIWVLFVFV